MNQIQSYTLHQDSQDRVIQQLRQVDLAAGNPFLYHSNLLPDEQVFFEYPDGSFQVETRTGTGIFQVLRSATSDEITALKQEYAHLF